MTYPSSLVVSGAGTTAANGTYTQGSNDAQGNPTWAIGTTAFISWSVTASMWYIGSAAAPGPGGPTGSPWYTSNATLANGPVGSAYVVSSGAAPAPAVSAGTNYGNSSAQSNTVTETPNYTPAGPTNLVGTPGNGTVALSWTPPPTYGHIQVWRTAAGGSTFSLLTTMANPATAYTDTTVTNGLTYQYYVVATSL